MKSPAAPHPARTGMEAPPDDDGAQQTSLVVEPRNIWLDGCGDRPSTCRTSREQRACKSGPAERGTHTCRQAEPSSWQTFPAYPSPPSRTRRQQKRTGSIHLAADGDQTPLSDCVQGNDIEEQASEPPTFHQEASAFARAPFSLDLFQIADASHPPGTSTHDPHTYTISRPLKSLRARFISTICAFFYVSTLTFSVAFLYIEDTSCRQAFAERRTFECLLWVAVHVCAIAFYIWVGINPGYIRKPEEYPEGLSTTFPVSVPAEGGSIHRISFIPSHTSDSEKDGHQSNVTGHSFLEVCTQHTLSPETGCDKGGKMRRATSAVSMYEDLAAATCATDVVAITCSTDMAAITCSADQCGNKSQCSSTCYVGEGKTPSPRDSSNSQRRAHAAHWESGALWKETNVDGNDDPIDFGCSVSEKQTTAGVETRDSLIVTNSGFCVLDRRCYTFCIYCRVLQPLRTRHCAECNHCVLTYDHHCAFLGCCIGEFNHWRFYLFLLSQTIAVTWDSAAAGLLAYHTYLILSNQTTWDWHLTWKHGDEIPFNVFDNDYYDCGC
ncbi:putative zinc finger DHHC domain-containing protein [Neospora caninum Liverpool]|uniref:Palmitoyltransferase n=1 Tax=Neospora caninum (strain Liverpool) TaxID=572307 RepID=F0VQC1_NEOCL|nr:putative zinc finger DHHC domain-containing protein [Neospora caninum Liverpool]CBZ55918.1 putative zinc finger DHHC domain-containing protein [Neospora caninum Liverpool]CEL70661.1 TPA: zinc finger DHHC domain-containing protein,putative [Neospora caninum Liverpool]|eukprot:XP_003885944.1 putative zinc finger DHHC domain-containing protein [Neospora caninum Liverpool]